ncbi:MAG: TonB-dependent receptor plug domain-containing protein [Granulosicoccus sp.]
MVIGRKVAQSLLCCFAGLAHAKNLVANDEFFLDAENVPIVLSASRLRQPISESPASITVVDRQLIEQSGARSIVDILLLVPGFQVGRRVNGNPVATYHGLAERYNPRLQLLVDGRPTYVPLFGGIPWGELPIALTDIERVEVTRAPNAATFGPNSFAAVVSITTRNPASDSGWHSVSETGGNKYSSSTLTYYGTRGPFDYRFTLQAENDEGYRNIADKERSRLLGFRSIWQLNATDRIDFDIGILSGGHVELEPFENPDLYAPYEKSTNAYTQMRWEHSHSADDSWRLQYYHNYYDVRYEDQHTFNLGEVLSDDQYADRFYSVDLNWNTRSLRHELEFQRSMRISNHTRAVFGGALRRDVVEGRFIFNDDKAHIIDTQRIFSHAEIEVTNTALFNVGWLLENNSLSGFTMSPRASIIQKISPKKQLRLGYSRGVRSPLLFEEVGEIVQDYNFTDGSVLTDYFFSDLAELQPETIDVVDVGYYEVALNRKLMLDAKLSWQVLNNLIDNKIAPLEQDTFDGVSGYFINASGYSYNTAEFQIDYKSSPDYRFRASYSYAFNMDSELNRQRFVPQHTVSLFGSTRVSDSITLSAEYYHASEWIWDDVEDLSNLDRVDLRIAKQIELGKTEINLAIQAEWDTGDTVNYLERNKVEDMYFAKLVIRLP